MKKSALSRLGRRTEAPPISWLMQLTLDHPNLISLAAGFTDNESLPVEETRESLNEILASPGSGRAALQYGSTAGDPHLRRLTADRLWKLDSMEGTDFNSSADAFPRRASDVRGALRRHGVAARGNYSPERMLITSGSQQLLYMLSECLCELGDIVLVEDPTYFVFLGIAQSHGFSCRGIRLAADGIDVSHLEQTLESLRRRGELNRVKMLYLVSYSQNPTGITTSFVKKAAALATLKRFEPAAGGPPDLPAGRRGLSRIALCRQRCGVGPGGGRGGRTGDLHWHLQQAVCNRSARWLRDIAEATLEGCAAREGQP
jgi:2-aminoadipate transaminase